MQEINKVIKRYEDKTGILSDRVQRVRSINPIKIIKLLMRFVVIIKKYSRISKSFLRTEKMIICALFFSKSYFLLELLQREFNDVTTLLNIIRNVAT